MIGSIKDLNIGDTITYTTVYGTRTYAVETVEIIDSTDWSYLQSTADNRVTLTTCLADQPSKRVCVQAVEFVHKKFKSIFSVPNLPHILVRERKNALVSWEFVFVT